MAVGIGASASLEGNASSRLGSKTLKKLEDPNLLAKKTLGNS